MNYRMTVHVLGILMIVEGALLCVPALTAAVYREPSGMIFVALAAALVLAGFVITRFKPQKRTLFARDGFVIVSLSWILMSVFGALPFVISGCIPSFIDALFESVSGFTTTGASILSEVESLPKCMLMWRSFTHWIGGMGVLVFIMAILPLSGGTNMYLMKAESPGPSVSKLVPRVRTTALLLYVIYFVMTLAEFLLLLAGEMDAFEAFTIACATAGTGGFAVTNAGIGGYSAYSQIVITVFMILFAVNFTSYFLILHKKFKEAFSTEIRAYLIIVALTITTVSVDIRHLFGSAGEAVRHAAFTVGSLMSSTGFATEDFNLWPTLSKTILVLLMFVGACAGSTGGGIKVQRFLILGKSMRNEFRVMLHPKQVRKVKLDGHQIEPEVVRNINAYIFLYFLIYVVSMLVLSLDGFDLTTNFTGVVATLNNIGPGLNAVGPTGNYALFSPLSKSVLIFDMLAGRLELYPMILLFSPLTWKK